MGTFLDFEQQVQHRVAYRGLHGRYGGQPRANELRFRGPPSLDSRARFDDLRGGDRSAFAIAGLAAARLKLDHRIPPARNRLLQTPRLELRDLERMAGALWRREGQGRYRQSAFHIHLM